MRRGLYLRLILIGTMVGIGVSCSRQGEENSNSAQSPPSGGAESGGGSMAGQQTNQTGPIMKFEQPPITDVRMVVGTNNSEALWTRSVNLSGVTVQQNLHDEGFILIGTDDQHTVLVQLDKPHPKLGEGQKVDLTGTIDPMGKDLSQWNVKPADRQVFQEHTMFISATSVAPSGGK